jgi:hypothetical protein
MTYTDSDVTEAQALGVPLATPVLADLKGRFHRAIEQHAEGEPVRYELFMFPLPTEQRDTQGNVQLVAMIGLYIEIKGMVLNTAISMTRVMQPNGYNDEVVAAHVRESLDGLRGARRSQLAQQEADAKAAMDRGEQPPVAGMINPDGRPNGTFDDIAQAMNGFARGE